LLHTRTLFALLKPSSGNLRTSGGASVVPTFIYMRRVVAILRNLAQSFPFLLTKLFPVETIVDAALISSPIYFAESSYDARFGKILSPTL